MPNIPWRKSGDGWYSNLRGGFRISYDSVGIVQMTFLRLLSKEAHQNMTYTCINSVAWYDNEARNYDNSIKLMGANDDEFSAVNNKPNVDIDGCKVILKFLTFEITGFIFTIWLYCKEKNEHNLGQSDRRWAVLFSSYVASPSLR